MTDCFSGVASCSGSLWYPDFELSDNVPAGSHIYLSLGTKEEKTKHPLMSRVGKITRKLNRIYEASDRVERTILEWNPGNHFKDAEARMVKGFAWLLKNSKIKR